MQRWRAWLAETHSSAFELRRHFFARFFDSEFIASPEQGKVVAGGALAILVSLSLIYTQAYYHKYLALGSLEDPGPFRRAELADVLFIVTLVMVVMGLFTALQWPALFPDLRDYLALAALPVRMRDVFAAKFAALAGFAALAVAATASLPSVVLPAVIAGGWDPVAVWQIPGIFLSSALAGLFAFFSLVALQGLLLNLVPARLFQRVSLAAQGLLVIVLVCSLPFVFSIPELQAHMNERPPWAVWAPPLWFLGLDQIIVGNAEQLPRQLAKLSVSGAAGSAAAAVLTYLWSYRRHRIRVLESPPRGGQNVNPAFPAAVADRLLPDPRSLAVFGFTAKSLARSRHHRLVLTAFCAIALAVIAEGFASIVFRGAWRALPVAVLTLPAEIRLLGVRAGLLATLVCLLFSLILVEMLLFSFEKVPFTSSYLSGRHPLVETVLRYAVASALYVAALSSLVRWSLQNTAWAAGLIAVLLASWWKARQARLAWQQVERLEFEEAPEPAVQVLRIERD